MSMLTIPERPYLKPWWRVTREATKVTFDYGDGTVLCEGNNADAVVTHLVSRLDGEHTLDEILASFEEPARHLVSRTLESFAQNQLLTTGPPVPASASTDIAAAAQFVAATQPRPTSVAHDAQTLQTLHVGVIGSSTAAEEFVRLLTDVGTVSRLSWSPTDEELEAADLIVVAPSPHELPRLSSWNERAIEAATTWLQILPYDGSFAAVGPLYVPDETCCYRCFQHRRASNRNYPAELFWAMQATPAPFPQLLALDAMVAGLATLAIIRWHTRRDASLPGCFQAIEIDREISVRSHMVYRVPRCEACASTVAVAPLSPWFEEVTR